MDTCLHAPNIRCSNCISFWNDESRPASIWVKPTEEYKVQFSSGVTDLSDETIEKIARKVVELMIEDINKSFT